MLHLVQLSMELHNTYVLTEIFQLSYCLQESLGDACKYSFHETCEHKYLFQWVVVITNSLVPWLQLSWVIISIIPRIRRGWRAEVRWRSIRTNTVLIVALAVVSGWLPSHSNVLTCYCFKSLILFFRQAKLLEALYLWHKLHIELLTISIWSIFWISKHF